MPLPSESQVGIDMGIVNFATLSDKSVIENQQYIDKYQNKIRRLNRSLVRKKRYSNNWYKIKRQLNKTYAKMRNTRMDFLHKVSSQIINKYGFIAVEDLNIQSMLTYKKINKAIVDVGCGYFLSMLEYKSKWYNRVFVKVDHKYTSQTCNHCGAIDKKSRISQSEFVCTNCGTVINADINASINILRIGLGKPVSAKVTQ